LTGCDYTAIAFNQLSHVASCYAKLAAFSVAVATHDYRQRLFCIPTEGWPGWVRLCGLLEYD